MVHLNSIIIYNTGINVQHFLIGASTMLNNDFNHYENYQFLRLFLYCSSLVIDITKLKIKICVYPE